MAKKKGPRSKRWSIDDKFVGKELKKCDAAMKEIKRLIGKGGDFTNGAKTLIAAVEYLNNEATDTQQLMDAYNKFNNETLVDLRKQLNGMDSQLQHLDRIAK